MVGVPHVNLDRIDIDKEIINLVPEKIAKRHYLIPVGIENNKIIVAMTYPFNLYAVDDVRFSTNKEVFPKIATLEDIKVAIEKYYSPFEDKIDEDKSKENEEKTENLSNINEIKEEPVIKRKIIIDDRIKDIVSNLINNGIEKNVTDIHIEPKKNFVKVRYRIEGELREIEKLDLQDLDSITKYIKDFSHLNFEVFDIPQTSKINYKYNKKDYNLKISTIPTIYGEKVHIHYSLETFALRDISKLGFSSDDLSKFNSILQKTSGLILISGPISSGITTTLYSMLKNISNPSKNIISIENPCELIIEGITQINSKGKYNNEFTDIFNSVLKQDPDVIAVSNINDLKTAEMTVNAANMGYLVFSTINGKDSLSALSRLIEMGISPYTIANSVLGVISQRLVKTLCINCAKSYNATKEEYEMMKKDFYLVDMDNIKLTKGEGCKKCNNIGFKDRTGVYEVLLMTQKLKEHIINKTAPEIIKKTAIIDGLKTIKENAFELALEGRTTINEAKKITNF
jgi:type IV pilus assembly protein PilB